MNRLAVKNDRVFSALRRGASLMLILALAVGLGLAGACHRKTPEEMLRDAYDLFQKRDILGAEMKYEKILEKNPQGQLAQAARIGLATCYIADNEFDRGREQLDLALKEIGTKNPECLQIIAMKLNSFIMEKKPDKALAAAESTSATLHGAPEEVRQQFQLILAEVYLANDKADKAEQICHQVIKEWPNNSELHSAALDRIVMWAQSKKNYPKALATYEEYLNSHPDTPLKAELLFYIGALQKQTGQADKAKASFDASEAELHKQIEKAMGEDAKGTLILKLAAVQKSRGNTAAARATLQKMLKEFQGKDNQAAAKLMLADIDMAENKVPEAMGVLQEIVKEYPANSQPYYLAMQRLQMIQARAMQPTTATLARGGMTTGTLAPTTGTLPRPSAAPTTATKAAAPAAPKTPAAATPSAAPAAPKPAEKAPAPAAGKTKP